ncbi:MAG TPA: FHA domain-containing protein [Solirubrobacteraceae bacterium]|nr:FHA domain-containing protein [Solirubrobacteraceae bacterium]
MSQRCASCGAVNPQEANFCAQCGAPLAQATTAEPPTAAWRIDEDPAEPLAPQRLRATAGPALVIRAGGGREGESFPLSGEEVRIGRRPESDIFLDDVTVSRDHAKLLHGEEGWRIQDCGSLNGTYVNRVRIDSALLGEGDELQIGKYKLTFLGR